MKAKLTYGKLSFEWETPENDVGVVLRQILSAYPDREPVPATEPEIKPIEVPEPESEEEPEAPIEEEPEPEPQEEPEADDTIPPEPQEREPLGKAIERLQREKKMRGGKKNCTAVVLKKDGEQKWFETNVEAAIFLDVNASAISRAKNKTYKVKGWQVISDRPKTKL
jgi:outer membrane biosynthesis protein TonB